MLSLDVMDISGDLQRDLTHQITKTWLPSTGEEVQKNMGELCNDIDKLNGQRQSGYCGSCYGRVEPEGGCCNSCDSVRQVLRRKGLELLEPDGIEQVRTSVKCFSVLLSIYLHNCLLHYGTDCLDNSVSRSIGQTTSTSEPQKAATSKVLCV